MADSSIYENFVEKYVKVVFKEKDTGLIGKLKEAGEERLILKPVTVTPQKEEGDILGLSEVLKRMVYQFKENTEAIVDASAVAYIIDVDFLGIPSEEIERHIKEKEK